MKVTVDYKGKSVELDIPDEKLEELVKEQKKTGWEKPKCNENYYFINHHGEVEPDHNFGLGFCTKCYESGNCFTSEELVKNISRYQSLDLRIRRRIAEICEPVDWSDPYNLKYGVVYNHELHEISIRCMNITHNCGWYCDTTKHAEQIVKEFYDELTWYFTEFKDRMDG